VAESAATHASFRGEALDAEPSARVGENARSDRFPIEPLPEMLKPLTRAEFEQYRDELAVRLCDVALAT
jgi:hypothetical protein